MEKTAEALLELWKMGGHFACGVIVGTVLSHFAHKMAGKDRIERQKLEIEQQKTLYSQLNVQTARIDELHKKLDSGGKGKSK